MAGVAEENRRRLASVLCLAGLVLILAGVVLIVQHHRQVAAAQAPLPRTSPDENIVLAQAIQILLFWLLVLVGIFGVSTLAFLRWSRRFRKLVLRRPREPTPADDLWARHQLPDESDGRSNPSGEHGTEGKD